MQILPKLDSGNAPDGYLPLLERSVSPAQPFSDVMNRLIDTAREQKNEGNETVGNGQKNSSNSVSQKQSVNSSKQESKKSTLSEVNSENKSDASESAVPSDITVDRETLAQIKNKLKEYGMSDESIAEISEEISSEGEISWKRLQKIISNKLELSEDSFDPELTEQEQTELLSLFQKLNFTVEQSNRLLEAVSGTDEAEDAWALIKKHVNALSDEKLKSVTSSEVSVLGKALGVSGSTQLTDALMGESATGTEDGSKAKSAMNLLFQQADEQSSYLSEKAAALKDILHTGLQAATKRGENSMLADNRSSKDVDNAKVRIEDGAEKRYGEKKTELGDGQGSESTASDSDEQSDTPVTQNKAYETESQTKQRESQAKNAGLPEQIGKASTTDSTEKADAQAKSAVNAGTKLTEQSEKASVAGAEVAAESQGAAEKSKAAIVVNDGPVLKDSKADKNVTNQKTDGEDANSKIAVNQKTAVQPEDSGKEFDTESGESQEKSGKGSKNLLSDKDENLVISSKKSSEQLSGSETKETKTETQKAWEDLLSKVKVEEGTVLQTNSSQQTESTSNSVANAKQEISAAHVMRTVENGVLSNMGQGRTQLTIRLDPPSLGQLTVSLQVKNDEVQAIIKTDSEEVGKMISDHLNLLRHSMEQHGLKVEKLDVQTQTQNNDGEKSWQSAEQHNQAQQQSQRDQMRTSLRTLQNLAMQGESLSQDALEDTAAAATNYDGLHLIA